MKCISIAEAQPDFAKFLAKLRKISQNALFYQKLISKTHYFTSFQTLKRTISTHLLVLSLSKYSLTPLCHPSPHLCRYNQADKADDDPKNPFQCCPEPRAFSSIRRIRETRVLYINRIPLLHIDGIYPNLGLYSLSHHIVAA